MGLSTLVALCRHWRGDDVLPESAGARVRRSPRGSPGCTGCSLTSTSWTRSTTPSIVQPIKRTSTGFLWRGVDAGLIDGTVNGVGLVVRGWSAVLRRLQTGSVRAYAMSLFVGVVSDAGVLPVAMNPSLDC